MSQWWSWALAAIGVTGLYLAGKRLAAGWAVGLAAQALWIAYGLATGQLGFVASAAAYAAVNIKNLVSWRRPVPAPPDVPVPMFPAPVSGLTANQRGGLPGALICDLDGTLCLRTGRCPYDETLVLTDAVNSPVLATVSAYHKFGAKIIFTSGRHEGCRADTQLWLARHLPPQIDYRLFMRADGDGRNDAIVKYEMYLQHIFDRYHVIAVLDDRDRVVDMWRAVGLTCFQVAPGDF